MNAEILGPRLSEIESDALGRCERIVDHGLKEFVRVGLALTEIRDRRLFRETHDSFELYVHGRWGMSKQRAYQLVNAAKVSQQFVDSAPQNEAQARPLARLDTPEQQREAWQAANERAQSEGRQVTAADVQAEVAARTSDVSGTEAYSGVKTESTEKKRAAIETMTSSQSVEWYTPEHIVDRAHQMLGPIDLDPASCAEANNVIKASRFYAADDDGLSQSWECETLWCNPPYGGATGDWVARFCEDTDYGEGLLLVNAFTDRSWFEHLWGLPLCFVRGRIKFWGPQGKGTNPTHGSVIAYMGEDWAKFREIFGGIGHIVLPSENGTDSEGYK